MCLQCSQCYSPTYSTPSTPPLRARLAPQRSLDTQTSRQLNAHSKQTTKMTKEARTGGKAGTKGGGGGAKKKTPLGHDLRAPKHSMDSNRPSKGGANMRDAATVGAMGCYSLCGQLLLLPAAACVCKRTRSRPGACTLTLTAPPPPHTHADAAAQDVQEARGARQERQAHQRGVGLGGGRQVDGGACMHACVHARASKLSTCLHLTPALPLAPPPAAASHRGCTQPLSPPPPTQPNTTLTTGPPIQGPAQHPHRARPPLVRQHARGGAEAAGGVPHRDGHQSERRVHRAAAREEAAHAAAGGPGEEAEGQAGGWAAAARGRGVVGAIERAREGAAALWLRCGCTPSSQSSQLGIRVRWAWSEVC